MQDPLRHSIREVFLQQIRLRISLGRSRQLHAAWSVLSYSALNTHWRTITVTGDRVFTTGEAAKLAYVSQQTIIRCVDNGSLGAHRVPGSRFRRIPERSLWKFLIEQNIPTDRIGGGKQFVLVASDADEHLPTPEGIDLTRVRSAFDLGMTLGEPWQRGVLLDYRMPGLLPLEAAHKLLFSEGFARWRKLHLIVRDTQVDALMTKFTDDGIVIHGEHSSLTSVTQQLIEQLTSQ